MKWHIFIMTVLMVCSHSLLAQSDKVDMRVILLETSGPEMSPDRSGYATLIEVGRKKLLFDSGRGVLQRLYESEVDIKKVTTVFLTHLHNDHIEGSASLWITPWFLLGRTEQMKIWGPVGTLKMRDGMRTMYGHDVQNRSDEHNKKESLDLKVIEIENPKENVCPKKDDPISLGQELYA